MSDTSLPDPDAQFSKQLAALIERAYNDGADVEGAWRCTIDGNGEFHWDIQITRVEYEEDEE